MDERVPGAEMLSVMMRGVEAAMKDEGILPSVRERVVNRLIWGEPEGLRAVRNIPGPSQRMSVAGRQIEPFGLLPDART